MMDLKTFLGIVAVVIGFLGYLPYILNVVRGTTKPHPFSWIVWAVLEAIAFFAQLASHAGPGAWVTGFSMIIAIGIAFYSLRTNRSAIQTLDVIAFCGALLGIVLWRITGDPLTAIVLVVISDALGFVPTFRKSWLRPHEETLTEYGLASLKFIVALFALQTFTITNWLYPVSLIITNGAFVIMSVIRRRQLE